MRSRLEGHIAAALTELQCAWTYESYVYASHKGQYLPDFLVEDILVVREREVDRRMDILVEAVATEERFDARWRREFGIVRESTDNPLLYVGMKEAPARLAGLCLMADEKPLMACLGQLLVDSDHSEPALYLDRLARIWVDGYMAAFTPTLKLN